LRTRSVRQEGIGSLIKDFWNSPDVIEASHTMIGDSSPIKDFWNSPDDIEVSQTMIGDKIDLSGWFL